ncbi:MAG: hypothetical protein KDD64_00195 [Bdellovibrionales bacterium]|nr:hypothetical protein [Bdellovibrionales bacterium]
MTEESTLDEESSSSQGARAETDFFPDYSLSYKRRFGAFLFLFGLLMYHRLPVVEHLSTAYYGGARGDAGLYVWLTRSIGDALSWRRWFDTSAFFPYRETLAWSDNFILPSLCTQALEALGFSHIAAYNLVLLGAGLLAGYWTFRLAYLISGQFLGSLLSGSTFLSLGYLSGVSGHPQLQFVFFFPLVFYFFFRFVSSPSYSRSFIIGLGLSGAFLTTVYFALFSGFAVVLLFCAFSVLRPWRMNRFAASRFIVGVSVGLVPAAPFIVPYFDVANIFSARDIFEAFAFRASPLSYFAGSEHNVLYSFTNSLSHAEAHLFPGFVFYLLSFIPIALLWWVRSLRPYYLGVILSGVFGSALVALDPKVANSFIQSVIHGFVIFLLWLSWFLFAGALYRLGRREEETGVLFVTNRSLTLLIGFLAYSFYLLSLGPVFDPRATSLGSFSPFGILYHIVPGFDSMRAISRCGVLVLLFLSVQLSFSTVSLKRVRRAEVVVGLLFLFIYGENLVRYIDLETPQKLPTVLSEVQKVAQREDVIMFLPWTQEINPSGGVKSWGDFARKNSIYMNWSAQIGLKTTNGYSGLRSKLMKELPRKMSGFPDQRSLTTLAFLGNVRFVVLCPYLLEGFDENYFREELSLYENDLKLLGQDEDGNFAFEFIGESKVREALQVLLPAHSRSFVHLEVKSLYQPNSPEIPLTLRESLHYQGEALGTLTIKSDGQWQGFLLPLPEPKVPVIPFQLQFETTEGSAVYVKDVRAVPGESSEEEM